VGVHRIPAAGDAFSGARQKQDDTLDAQYSGFERLYGWATAPGSSRATSLSKLTPSATTTCVFSTAGASVEAVPVAGTWSSSMLISGISADDLEVTSELASEALGNELIFTEFDSYSPKRHRVRLQVRDIDGPGARRHSYSYYLGYAKAPRRSRCACGHAYGMLMVAIYERAPEARIETALITYRDARDFLLHYEDALYRNVGSRRMPIAYADECTCETDDIGTDTIEEWRLGVAEMPSVENTATVAR
jgi:hypothetical protein